MSKNLIPLQIVLSGNMAQNITSSVVDGRYLWHLKFQLVWSGTPVGAFSLQESLDYVPNPAGGTPINAGTFIDNGSGVLGPSGAGGTVLINLSNRAPCFYRLVYIATSGAGTLNAYASGQGS